MTGDEQAVKVEQAVLGALMIDKNTLRKKGTGHG